MFLGNIIPRLRKGRGENIFFLDQKAQPKQGQVRGQFAE